MTLQKELRAALLLALPMAGAQLAQVSLHIIDTLMCGRLGALALAGAGLGTAAFSMIMLPLLGVIGAVAPMVSQAYGANDSEQVRRSLSQALILGLLIALPGMILLTAAAPLMQWAGQPAEAVAIAGTYLQAARWSLLPALWVGALRYFLDSLSRPRIALIVTVSAIVINVLVNWVLMFGNLGFPALGVAGTGWATTLVNLWMLMALLLFARWDPALKPYLYWTAQPDREMLLGLLRLGLPMALTIMAEVWLFVGLTFLMGLLGTVPLAAHQVALNISTLTFMFALGVANATTVRVGQALGRGVPAAARQAGISGMLLGMSAMSLSGLVFWFAPRLVIAFYLNLEAAENQAVVDMTVLLLRLAALFQLFDALQVTSQGALRGFKDTFVPMCISFMAYWIVGLGSALFLGFYLERGAVGLWSGLIVGLAAAAFSLSARFFWRARLA
ncbi:MAG: MATE family efflux transporter [Candidatus Sericytochromatia bacterium]|nr:MATE family efflux transporter [Candidatus Sericytochromatia bacterium]